MSVHRLHAWCSKWPDPLNLELQMVTSPHVGAGNGPWSSGRGASPLNQFLSDPTCLQNPQFNAVVRLSSTSQSL